jgi:DNA transformation protein and related proteins
MAVRAQYLAYVLEQLAGLASVSTRRMFGAVGLYSGESFFAVVDDDTLFFKTDESNYPDYQARNMPRFMPTSKRPQGPRGYHQVPAEIIEDGESLVAWARKAVAAALASQARKTTKATPRARLVNAKQKPAKRKPARPAKARNKR